MSLKLSSYTKNKFLRARRCPWLLMNLREEDAHRPLQAPRSSVSWRSQGSPPSEKDIQLTLFSDTSPHLARHHETRYCQETEPKSSQDLEHLEESALNNVTYFHVSWIKVLQRSGRHYFHRRVLQIVDDPAPAGRTEGSLLCKILLSVINTHIWRHVSTGAQCTAGLCVVYCAQITPKSH